VLNDPNAGSQGRLPRGIVTLNGTPIVFSEFEVQNKAVYEADTFMVRLPMYGQAEAFNLGYWATTTAIPVYIYAGFPQNPNQFLTIDELDNIFVGKVDNFEVGEGTDQGIHVVLTGRSLAGDLIDTKTTQKYQNLTASQIATQIAEEHHLTPVVKSTSTLVGTYYQIDYSRLNVARSEWDLLTYLAQQEGFYVSVRGTSLYFQPAPDSNSNPYIINWAVPDPLIQQLGKPTSNTTRINFRRALTIANDLIVKVRSWNMKTHQAYTYTARATPSEKTVIKNLPQPTGQAQTIIQVRPGLSKEQTLQYAQQLLRQVSQHQVVLEATLPADNILMPDSVIQVTGSNSGFDQVYYPSVITRRMNMQEGYVMDVEAKNISPITQILI
jgi:phage protein D